VHAFADESYNDAGLVYIFGAVLGNPANLDPIRSSARGALQQGRDPVAKPFHWQKEWPATRKRMLRETVVKHGLVTYAFCRSNVARTQQEQARVACFDAMVSELSVVGVTDLMWDERSGHGQAAKDLLTVRELVNAGVAPPAFRYGSGRPSVEAMIWIADCVAGAVNSELQADATYVLLIDLGLSRRQVP
jgi:hypothetical protein